ncbi:nucleic-acid-binding protein from transposon X-element [Trichonephila clavipes]|nr:nucleic-acid-binding protein from transposon X-element [Trichonephila clavipes]
MTGQYIKLYTDSFNQYHKLSSLLENLKFPHNPITPKTERPIKVVNKGLPLNTKATNIHSDLIDLGFTVSRVTELVGNISEQLLPVFSISLPRNLTKAKIFDLKTLSCLSITVEGFERKGETQCFQCNQFNHTANQCHLTPTCLKCANDHQTRQCQIKRVDTLFCINCQTYGHMANYFKGSRKPLYRQC